MRIKLKIKFQMGGEDMIMGKKAKRSLGSSKSLSLPAK